MRILTLGDSWTYGSESSNPETKSWPSQLAQKHNVQITNLARGGSSNQRASRIGIEELCRDPCYDWVIWPLGPASRTEILKNGKWHQIWPNLGNSPLDRLYTEFWMPWNDVQITMLLVAQFLSFVKSIGPKLLIVGLSLSPRQYLKEIYWINNYNNDNDFLSLGMPLEKMNIGIKDLDRKLKSLKGINQYILKNQPDYLFDVPYQYMNSQQIKNLYGSDIWAPGGHPNDLGYEILSDYFASKIGLI